MARVNPIPPIVTGPCFRIKLFGIILGQQTVSTFYLIPATAPTVTPTPTVILTAFLAQIVTAWNGALNANWDGDINTCDRFDDPQVAQVKAASALGGTQAADSLPTFATMKLRKLTPLGGQRGRGVLRLPGVSESASDGNLINAGQIIFNGALAVALIQSTGTANPAEGTWQPALLTRTIGLGPVFPVTIRGVAITSWVVDPLLGRQITRQQIFRG